MTWVRVVRADDGVQLWATRAGDGAPVVFCHGGPPGLLWDTLDAVSEMLEGSRTVLRWDQRGCGRSEWRGPYTVASTVADLDAVRRHFGSERIALLGHSWGARIALLYALAHPERVSRLVYVSGTGIDPGWPWLDAYEQNLARNLGEHLGRWKMLQARDRTDSEDRELGVLRWSVDFADRAWAYEHAERMVTPWFGANQERTVAMSADMEKVLASMDLYERCRTLEVPTLIVDGTEDIRPRWSVDSLEQALPSVSRMTLEGAGHMPWVEATDQLRDAVVAFLTAESWN